jgi:hypothetical protein
VDPIRKSGRTNRQKHNDRSLGIATSPFSRAREPAPCLAELRKTSVWQPTVSTAHCSTIRRISQGEQPIFELDNAVMAPQGGPLSIPQAVLNRLPCQRRSGDSRRAARPGLIGSGVDWSLNSRTQFHDTGRPGPRRHRGVGRRDIDVEVMAAEACPIICCAASDGLLRCRVDEPRLEIRIASTQPSGVSRDRWDLGRPHGLDFR